MKRKLMNHIKMFTSSQRKGIFVLLLIIFSIQIFYFFYKNRKSSFEDFQIDQASISFFQKQIDSLKANKSKTKIYPFNPNFINDKKGYFLKMKLEEIDKLLAFRKTDKYVNSAKEFQQITGVSDQWLATYSPYFKFPDWTQNKNSKTVFDCVKTTQNLPIKDINKVTTADLLLINGIGPTFADRIINERNKYNGFVHIDQVDYIYGLPPEVIVSLKKYFRVISKPEIVKINLNTASKDNLTKIPYINNQLAREILIFRSKSDNLLKIEDLKKNKGFPIDKINIIALYLDN